MPVRRPGRIAWRIARSSATAAVLAALAAGPASAALGPQGVRLDHNVTVFENIDMVASFGHQGGAPTQVDVFRGEHRIATARGRAVDDGEGGALEVNHGPEGAALPGDCFEGATPDVQPGDRVVVSNPGQAGVDEVIVDGITIDSVTQETPGEVWVQGTAMQVTAEGATAPIPLAQLDSGEFRDPGDNQLRLAPTEVVEGPAPGTYIAKYVEGRFNIERNRNNRDNAYILSALMNPDGHGFGYGHVDPLPPVSMLAEGSQEASAPAAGCEAAPKYASSAATTSVDTLNHADAGPHTTGPVLTVGGFAAQEVTDAEVVVSDETSSVAEAVTLSAGPGQKGWSASFDATDLAGMADGELTAQLRVAGALVGAVKHVGYDLTAPAIAVSLAAGRYTGMQAVRVLDPETKVTYRLDDGPTLEWAGVPIVLGIGTHTLELRSEDAAGNVATRTLTYVIEPTPPRPVIVPDHEPEAPASPSPPRPPSPSPSAVAPAAAATPVAATALRTSRRVRWASAKRKGLKVRFTAPDGASRAIVRVYRMRGSRAVAVGARTIETRPGTNTARLNMRALRRKLKRGRYRIAVSLEGRDGTAGKWASVSTRVVR
jgi:hypothetical protein